MNPLLSRPMEVYVIGRPSFDTNEMSRFLSNESAQWLPTTTSDAENLVEVAGRVCYMSYGKGRKTNREFLENIMTSGHGSVLEHASWTLLITGVSRSLTHELVRHRHLSYSQLSQRYVDETDVSYVIPAPIIETGFDTWIRLITAAKTAYTILEGALKRNNKENGTNEIKAARQAARSVLPNATETKIVVSGNARAWRHFIETRGSVYAEPEIRALAIKILAALEGDAPVIFGDYDASSGCVVGKYRKV